jgi:hypothetical protein
MSTDELGDRCAAGESKGRDAVARREGEAVSARLYTETFLLEIVFTMVSGTLSRGFIETF